jgi:anti-anti-sigma factor
VSAGEIYYRFESVNGCLTVTLLPELNDKQWADIERVGTEIVARIGATPSPRVIVDLTQLSYMGSAMVALIVRLYKEVNTRSGKMVVVNQHELVHEVLKLAGLTKLWTIVDNRQAAYSSLGIKMNTVSGTGGGLQTGGMGLVAAGAIGTVGALLLLALQFSSNPAIPRKYALLVECGFAFLGLVAGMMLLNQAGNRRNLGIAFLAICVLAVFGAIVATPDEAPAKGAAPPAANTAAGADENVKATPAAAEAPVTEPAKAAPAAVASAPATPAPATPTKGKSRPKRLPNTTFGGGAVD